MPRPARAIGWTAIFCLAAGVTALLLRESAKPETPPPASSSGKAPEATEMSVLTLPPGPAPAPPTVPESKTDSSKPHTTLEIVVRDIFGIPVRDPGISFEVPGDSGISLEKGEEGRTRFRVYKPKGEVRIRCGDYEGAFALASGINDFQVPGTDGARFGELAIRPVEWETVRVRLKGASTWKTPEAIDQELGRRFLFVLPGIYEIADQNGIPAGRVSVTAGKRTSYALDRVAGIKIAFKWSNFSESKRRPGTTRIRIQGRSEDASYRDGHQVVLETVKPEASLVEFGLEPGLYEVTSEDHEPRFIETFHLRGGEFKVVEIQHWLK